MIELLGNDHCILELRLIRTLIRTHGFDRQLRFPEFCVISSIRFTCLSGVRQEYGWNLDRTLGWNELKRVKRGE